MTTPYETTLLQSLLNKEFRQHLVLLSGENMQGLPFFVILAIAEANMPAFETAQQQAGFDPSQYGKILARGFASEPPPLLKLEAIDRFKAGQF